MITIDDITKTIPSDEHPPPALRRVGFTITSGSVFGLLGPAKAGKSTLLRLIAIAERPDTGRVLVDDVDPAELGTREQRALRAQFAMVDDYRLRSERTVAGNIAAPLERLGLDGPARRARVSELLDLVGLGRAAAALPGELNEGQRRRVALARGLATQPSVLLLDDPTEGLDAEQSGGVLATIDRASAELGITVVLATRDAGVVRKVCDSVALLADGRLLESGSLLTLLADLDSYTTHALLPSVTAPANERSYDAVADVLLIGHATVGTLLGAAVERNEVRIATLDGGETRVAETPVARYRIGLDGERAEAALGWIADHGGVVQTRSRTRSTAAPAPAVREVAELLAA